MGVTTDAVAANEAERVRLVALTGRLTDADLVRTLGGEWTVATALAHLAFWDHRSTLLLEHWEQGNVVRDDPAWYDDVNNRALLPQWQAIPSREAVRLALEAAEAVNRKVASLAPEIADAIVARDEAWLLRRHNHRREHLDQIERALAG